MDPPAIARPAELSTRSGPQGNGAAVLVPDMGSARYIVQCAVRRTVRWVCSQGAAAVRDGGTPAAGTPVRLPGNPQDANTAPADSRTRGGE